VDTVDQFEEYRPLMFGVAYRMLGSVPEAEDAVQNAYIRYSQMPPGSINSPKAFLSTVVTRLCLNQLQSARAQRESYLGPWLPDPLLTEDDPRSPTRRAETLESISMAFLVLLERLTPVERAVFLLREVFDYSYAEIAEIVEKGEDAVRQIFHRAKKFLADERPRFTPSTRHHEELLGSFMRAVQDGDLGGLTALLASDVTMWADAGGKVRGAATRPLHGPYAVAQFMIGSLRFVRGTLTAEIRSINGEPALLLREDGKPLVVVSMTIAGDETIRDIRVIGNPDKLAHLV
jgi:RNA polymerase sigma-70 factor (ECF subfamily)